MLASASVQVPQIASFYIVTEHFSDARPGPFEVVTEERLLDVVRVDNGVRVRLIRFTWRGGCPGMWVEAAERVIPRTSVASMSGVDLCAIDEKKAASTLKRSRIRNLMVFASDYDTIVAACQGRVKVFHLSDSTLYNMESLRSRNSALAQAVEMFTRVRDRAFGDENPFEHYGQQLTPEQQKVAAAAVADLESGRFKEGLGKDERRYRVTDRPSSSDAEALLEPATLKFDSYQPVRFPPIAMAARIFGDVRLRLTVVPTTGIVTDVAVVSGAPLLAPDAAAAVARTWRLAPGSAASDRIDVTLKFRSPCGM
jgi:hypothetical protein